MNQKHQKNILFTRKLSNTQISFAKQNNIAVEDHPFIDIEIKQLSTEQREIISSSENSAWIFTSVNAIKCLEQNFPDLSSLSPAICYAVGDKTAQALEKYQFEVGIPKIHNARSLVALLSQDEEDRKYLYFSGNLRQNTLIDFLTENEKDYTEIECYQTHMVQPDICTDDFDAIGFCSPSAVRSFFLKYQIADSIPCIAIGSTTAVKLLEYTENVVMAEETNIFSMIRMCKEYLNS